MTDSLKTLRGEMPALALTIGFAPGAQRQAIATLLLFWLELRRAGLTGEAMVRATRMAWWRDALREARGDAVPLAENLIKMNINKELSGDIDVLVEAILESGRAIAPHDIIARYLAPVTGAGAEAIAATLTRLDGAIAGEAGPPQKRSGIAVFDLLDWCCEVPSRLEYPHRHPLLALRMMVRVVFR